MPPTRRTNLNWQQPANPESSAGMLREITCASDEPTRLASEAIDWPSGTKAISIRD